MSTPLKNANPGFITDDTVNIKRYLSLFISNWYWFAVTLFISLSIAYGVNRYSEQVYTVSSTLLIKDDQMGGGISGTDAFIPGGEFFKSRQNLKNEMGILKSFTLNKRVIDSLPEFHIIYVAIGRRNIVENRQYENTPFIVIPETGNSQPPGKLFIKISSENVYEIQTSENSEKKDMKFGDLFDENGFSFRILKRNPDSFGYNKDLSNKYYFWFANLVELANQYRSNLSITPIEEDASLVYLSLSGPVSKQEADYLNMLMELYIKQGLEFKNETAEKTIEFINGQLGIISDSLTTAEKNLEYFRFQNKLVDISREGVLIQTKLEKYESEKTDLALQRKYFDYLQSYLVSKNETGDIVSPTILGVTDPQVIRLVQELAVLQREKKQLSLNLTNNSTPLALIEEGIERKKMSLNENVNGAIENLNSSLDDVNNRISLVELDISKIPGTERQMINIQRKFDVNNSVYTYLLEKRAEAGIGKASNVSDNKIIDKANSFNSSIVKPKTQRNYLLAFMLGFLIPVFGIYIVDYLNNKIIDKSDIERGTDAPIIGYISHNEFKSEMPVKEKPGSTLAESFRSVRTSLKFFIKDNKTPVIAVSSTISAEGKTFISINLAIITASLGKRVLLIGLDLRKPRIHKVLGSENSKGLSLYLSGDLEYKDCIQQTEVTNLFYAPSGPIPPNPAELIETEMMKEFIEKAKKEFDYIIIDTPPVAIVTDALLIAPLVDMYLLVVRQGYTSKNTLELVEDFYKNGSLKNLGIILNDISLTGYYGYGLRYGYSMGSGYSYGYNYYGQYVYARYGYSEKGRDYYKDGE